MSITPYLYYEDLEAARTFLQKAFGFRKEGRALKGKDGRLRHAAMKLDGDVVMMGYPGPDYQNPRRLGHTTQSLYVNVADVESLYRKAKKAGAVILEEPADTDYGHRRFGAVDPEGHQWYFAEESAK